VELVLAGGNGFDPPLPSLGELWNRIVDGFLEGRRGGGRSMCTVWV